MSTDIIYPGEVNVLDVGSGPNAVAQKFFPNGKVTRLDINEETKPDYVHDIREPFPEEVQGQFDVVFASHVLEHIERVKIVETIQNLAGALREEGEMWILVPSLEWAAKELMKDQPSPVVLPVIYGSQQSEWQFHKSGYTLFFLRQLVEMAGDLIVRQAHQGLMTVSYSDDDKTYPAIQNIVVAMKHNGTGG